MQRSGLFNRKRRAQESKAIQCSLRGDDKDRKRDTLQAMNRHESLRCFTDSYKHRLVFSRKLCSESSIGALGDDFGSHLPARKPTLKRSPKPCVGGGRDERSVFQRLQKSAAVLPCERW